MFKGSSIWVGYDPPILLLFFLTDADDGRTDGRSITDDG